MAITPTGFCVCEFGHIPDVDSLFRIIPAPLEKTVSYGGGTANGPEAILRTSEELEPIYLGAVPGEKGIEVISPVSCEGDITDVLDRIGEAVSEALSLQKIPITLGGEHTVTFGSVSGVMEHFSENEIGIVQIDAHADLRDHYGGDPYSHACVMRRIREKWSLPIHQIGIRGISQEEQTYREKSDYITWQDAPDVWKNGLADPLLPHDFPKKVYLTFDLDGLDASLMPSTGTPSPGGLFWHQAEAILEDLAAHRELIGFDVVELAPQSEFHAPDFTAAVAVYAGMWAAEKSRAEAS